MPETALDTPRLWVGFNDPAEAHQQFRWDRTGAPAASPSIRVRASVARAGGVGGAGGGRRVAVASLGQGLRGREERLGGRLMNRTTRSVGPTEAGELRLAGVGPAISDVGAALDQVRSLRGVPSGRDAS